ncbi:MAG: aspartate carbamoyltransferase regulatory subunit [Planctomycetota bacterium]|nr:aspartate carbamoyltransferase regulatory subunit [Planctomycetota bacterium]
MTIPRDFRLVDGTVIDHLPVGTAARALELLRLPREGPVTIGMNVPSSRHDKKDIIRVEGMVLEKRELDRLALLGEHVTVSIVQAGKVVDKIRLEVPKRLRGILTCTNPTCVTNNEPVQTVFERLGRYPFRFRCTYCERVLTL